MDFQEILNNAIAYILVLGGIGSVMIALAKIDERFNVISKIKKSFNKDVLDVLSSFKNDTNKRFDNIEKKQQDLQNVQNTMQLDILALKVVSKGLPEEARYIASKRYLEARGNSGVDILAKDYINYYANKHKSDI